ncbi:MAG: hypothetical protein JW839_17085, partial [Candidatus Lokiarchaeota archaeon]|nr:hypothetical protein [Candidatus Lokiarchaeota archaeon]
HLTSGPTEYPNNNESCVAYWNDLLNITLRYYYNDPLPTSVVDADVALVVKQGSTTIHTTSAFTYSPSTERYNLLVNVTTLGVTTGSQEYGKFFNLFFDAIKDGFQPNGTQFTTLNMLPFNTTLARNASDVSLIWGYQLNVTAAYADAIHSQAIAGATTSWVVQRPSTGQTWGPYAMIPSPSVAGNYSLLFDSTPFALGVYTMTITLSKETMLLQAAAISITVTEVPTLINASKTYTASFGGIVGQSWNLTLLYTRSDTGATLQDATAVFAWQNKDTGSNGTGTLSNAGPGLYNFTLVGSQVGTYEVTVTIHRERYEQRQAFLTVLVGKSDFDVSITPTSQAIVANDTAIYMITVRDRYNGSYVIDPALMTFVSPSALASSYSVTSLGNGTYNVTVRPWLDNTREGAFLLEFGLAKSIYNPRSVYLSLTVVDWPVAFTFSQTFYTMYKNQDLNVSLTLTDAWHSASFPGATVQGSIAGIAGATWGGATHVNFVDGGNGIYSYVIPAGATLASSAGSFLVSVNASVSIPSLATFEFTATASTTFSINDRPVICFGEFNQTSIPVYHDVSYSITLLDGLNASVIQPDRVSQIRVQFGTMSFLFTAGNWTFVAGKYIVVLANITLPVGAQPITTLVVTDNAMYLNASLAQTLFVRLQMIEWVVFPSLGTPVGFNTNVTFQLVDLDAPGYAFKPASSISWVNTTDNKVIDQGIVDSVTRWVLIDTEDHLAYPAGTLLHFTLVASGPGIDSSKTKNITVSIVDYALQTSFTSIPQSVGWNQTATQTYGFWVNPDDFGKIWLGSQDVPTVSNIHINVTARWLNGTQPIVPAGDITGVIGVDASLQTLGYFTVVLKAPAELNANEAMLYSLRFNVTAWYNRSGTVIPLFRSVAVDQAVNITRIDSTLLPADESGNVVSKALPQVETGASITFHVTYLAGATVTFSVVDASGATVSGLVDVPMDEVSTGLYRGTISGLADGTYTVVVHADPGASSNYRDAYLDLSVSVAQSFPWMFIIVVAAVAVALALVLSKAVRYYKVPRLVRIMDATIGQLGKEKSIQNVAIVRSLDDQLNDETKDAWAALGIESPYRPKAKKATEGAPAPKKGAAEGSTGYKEVS